MDQDAFRETYREVNENFCAFEKSVLINQCNCSKAERFCIAEREGVHCLSEEGQARCLDALSILRDHATFALRELTEGKLPHGKAMRVQIGGMRGLNKLLNGDDTQVPLSYKRQFNAGAHSSNSPSPRSCRALLLIKARHALAVVKKTRHAALRPL
jgi:hypothetical protein